MFTRFNLIGIVNLLLWSVHNNIETSHHVSSPLHVTDKIGQCQCGESTSKSINYYCGNELNRMKPNVTNCVSNQLYLCSTNNKTATSIGRCPSINARRSNSCNHGFISRNECLRHINCTCRGLKNTNQPICGHQLNGPGCLDHMVYQCRLIGSPTPLIDCRHSSCVNGRCSIDSRATTIESKQEQERLLPNVTSNEHEEEYVTFAPLIRVPFKFDP
ncbi:hypothetical protein BLOT_000351 [Blomia tropicalis]|nr:hypothetical protein BLOT_000351 [Blomia tropicalis]